MKSIFAIVAAAMLFVAIGCGNTKPASQAEPTVAPAAPAPAAPKAAAPKPADYAWETFTCPDGSRWLHRHRPSAEGGKRVFICANAVDELSGVFNFETPQEIVPATP